MYSRCPFKGVDHVHEEVVAGGLQENKVRSVGIATAQPPW